MDILGEKVFIGCDPEVFVFDTKRDKFIPAVGLVPGDKQNPHPVENGIVQVDGLALEFGIKPSETKKEFIDNIRSVMNQLQKMLPKNLKLMIEPKVYFDPNDLKKLPPEALELGCEPDWDAYTGEVNPRPTPTPDYLRSAGGHVHIGWGTGYNPLDSKHKTICETITREMDFYLGLKSLEWDSDSIRRSIYGKAGCFRPKSYGMEYRTLSNKWLSSKSLMGLIFDQTEKALISVASGENLKRPKTIKLDIKNLFSGSLEPKNIINNGIYFGGSYV